MDLDNVQDMPIKHNQLVTTLEQVQIIKDYCYNDVKATYQFFLKSLNKIRERQNIKQLTGLNCLNMSDSSIGENLILNDYAKLINCDTRDLEKMRTIRKDIHLGDIIFPQIKFSNLNFSRILNELKNTITNENNEVHKVLNVKGMILDVKKGGIHGCKKGIYTSDEKYIIKDEDVSSLYPTLYIKYKIFPEHLPYLGDVVVPYYEKRLESKRELKRKDLSDEKRTYHQDISNTYKLALNSIYGKFNDVYSFLYDYLCTLKVTINGELMILKWIDMLLESGIDFDIIQANTDGCTFLVNRNDLDRYNQVNQEFMKFSQYELESKDYSKICMRDVNNYFALDFDGKIKLKGDYNYEVGEDYHKSISFKASRKAVVNKILFDKSIEQSILENNNIFDFTGSVRFKKNESKGHFIKNNGDKIPTTDNLRFIASRKGYNLLKIYSGKVEAVHKGFKLMDANDIKNVSIEDVNRQFYITQAVDLYNSILFKNKKNITLNLF